MRIDLKNSFAEAPGEARSASGLARRFPKLPRQATGWLMIAPSIAFLLLMIIYPLLQTAYMSLHEFAGLRAQTATFVGLRNFVELIRDPLYQTSMRNTWIFVIGSLVGHLLLGSCFALALNQHWFSSWFRNLVRGILMLPWLFSFAATGLMWGLLMHPLGPINYLLADVGLLRQPLDFLGQPQTALLTLIIMNIWQFFPFYMMMILGGLQTIPDELYDAASVDGANSIQRFWHITLPMITDVIVAASAIDFITTFGVFDLVRILTNGGPRRSTITLGYYTWRVGFSDVNFGYGSAISVSVLLVVGITVFFYLRLVRRRDSLYA